MKRKTTSLNFKFQSWLLRKSFLLGSNGEVGHRLEWFHNKRTHKFKNI
jgi:hypothetical protein